MLIKIQISNFLESQFDYASAVINYSPFNLQIFHFFEPMPIQLNCFIFAIFIKFPEPMSMSKYKNKDYITKNHKILGPQNQLP